MPTARTISPDNSTLPDYLDFRELRRVGIDHCQELGSDLWTDFNLHDPGVTILEVLCYALTDLGYRTNLPIEDLIARSASQRALDAGQAGPDGKSLDDNFFTAEQILTCNPVTLLDLRKLLIDLPGVRNAWIERADRTETRFYVDDRRSELQYSPPEHLSDDAAGLARAEVTPDGLYVVCIDLEESEVPDACGTMAVPVDHVLGQVWSLLHRHRNLCEDFLDVVILGDERVAICADIEIAGTAAAEDVLLGVYTELHDFLAPAPQFYTLQEMIDQGKSMEEIYAGRPLTPLAHLVCGCPGACSHGFVDAEELAKTELRTTLHASDLLQVIMDVPGVLAVRKLQMVNYINDFAQTKGEKWCLHLTPKHRPIFDLRKSEISLYKGLLPSGGGEDEVATVERRFQEERQASSKAPLAGNQLDRGVPEGRYRDLDAYRSVVHEFPQVYGIAEGGLPASAPAARKAQANQLRAYLIFYDQILANYLSQLSNLRELFSLRPDWVDHRAQGGKNRTYFTQVLSDVPEIESLIQDYAACDFEPGYPLVPENYRDFLDYIVESEHTYGRRRNRFLDHLLARFAESFSDYVLLMFDVNGRQNNDRRLIRDKADFLSTYPETSRDRGKGYDLTQPAVWDTDNVSGLEKRVRRLLGFGADVDPDKPVTEHVPSRRTLAHAEVFQVGSVWRWRLEMDSGGEDGPVTLMGVEASDDKEGAAVARDRFLTHAASEANYRRLRRGDDTYGFTVLDAEGAVLARTDAWWETPEARDDHLLRLLCLVVGGDVACDVFQKVECFFYVLTDATGSEVLLESARGYETDDAAEAARAVFLDRAGDLDSYRDLDGDDFGFELLDGVGGEVLAVHPTRYPTSAERDARRQAIVYYVTRPDPTPQLVGPPATRGFAFIARDGEVMLESVVPYVSAEDAEEGYETFLDVAHRRSFYRKRGNLPGGLRFGFELQDRRDEVIARHPVAYATAGERDAALQRVEDLFDDLRPIRYRMDGVSGAFKLTLLDEEGAPLLRGIAGHASVEEARAALVILLNAAADADAYTRRRRSGRFGFELSHDGAVIARQPTTYDTAAERNRAIQSLIAEVNAANAAYALQLAPGRLTVVLSGSDGVELLRSRKTYLDRRGAERAAERLMEQARDPEAYRRTSRAGRFGFELRRRGRAIAERWGEYTTAGERDAALGVVLAYVSRNEIISYVEDREGAFAIGLLDSTGNERLSGTIVYPSDEDARAAFPELVELARRSHHYRRTMGSGPCPWGFEIVDSDVVVAVHPRTYGSEDEREQALQALMALVVSGETIAVGIDPDPDPESLPVPEGEPDSAEDDGEADDGIDVESESDSDSPTDTDSEAETDSGPEAESESDPESEPTPVAYHWELADVGGSVLLRSDETWPDPDDAREAFRTELVPIGFTRANYRVSKDGCEYGFAVYDGDVLIASHPRMYELPRERDAQIDVTIELLRPQDFEPLVRGEGCGYYFRFGADGHVLTSASRYPTSAWALSAAGPLLDDLDDPERYAIREVDDTHQLEVTVPDGSVSATSEPATLEELETIRDEWIAAATRETESRGSLAQERASLRCLIRDDDGTPLLASMTGSEFDLWATVGGFRHTGTRDAAMEATKELFDGSPDPGSFESEGDFYFTFDVPGHPQVVGHQAYGTEAAAAAGASDFLRIASLDDSYEPRYDAVSCEYSFDILDRSGLDDARKAACGACNRFVEAIQVPAHYRMIEAEHTCGFDFELWDTSGPVATPSALFPSRRVRAGFIDRLRGLADQEGFHLVEHLLMRPKEPGLPPAFAFAPARTEGGAPFFTSLDTYSEEGAVIALRSALEAVLSDSDEPFRALEPTPDGVSCSGFELVVGDEIMTLPEVFAPEVDREEAIAQLKADVQIQFGEEGGLDDEVLLDFVYDTRTERDGLQDAFLPLGLGCRDELGNICPVRADPYSFRATAVVPYWPERFQKFEFRQFFERTLRLETPAHVHLRICWVDVCQMREFEAAYRRWLGSLAGGDANCDRAAALTDHDPACDCTPTFNDGDPDCDRTPALNDLIDILSKLRSVYEPAHLAGGRTVKSPAVILDQTALGTAIVENDAS